MMQIDPNWRDETTWQKTQWLPGNLRPVHSGIYEIQTEQGSDSIKAIWSNGKWSVPKQSVRAWRGLTEKQYDALTFQQAAEVATPTPCESCDKEFTEFQLVEMSGQLVCPSCGEPWAFYFEE